MYEYQLITYPTWERYVVLAARIANLSIRERRLIFNTIKAHTCESVSDLLFPSFGFTVGEFAVWYMLNEYAGRRGKASS